MTTLLLPIPFSLLMMAYLGCNPGTTGGKDTTPPIDILPDQDVKYALANSFKGLQCTFTPDEAAIISKTSKESIVNAQALALALKWENGNGGTSMMKTEDVFNAACADLVKDLDFPVYSPPAGDCSGIVATNLVVEKIDVSTTMNGGQQLLRDALLGYPDGEWCQVSVKDTSHAENLIWAMLYAFDHFHTPAIVNWKDTPTVIHAATVRVPGVAVGSFQQLLEATTTTDFATNYPHLSASIVQLDYTTAAGAASLAGASSGAVILPDVRALLGSSSAVIDPLDQAHMTELDEFIGHIGNAFLGDDCQSSDDESLSEDFHLDAAYSDAPVRCLQ